MKYLNINQASKEIALNSASVAVLCQAGVFGRKLGNTWCITDKEINRYKAGHRAPLANLPPLYDSQQVIAMLGISRTAFYRLVAKGKIVGTEFGNRGGQPNLIFTEAQVAAALRVVSNMPKNGYRTVDADQYISEHNGRFYVAGTQDKDGNELSYKSRTIARERARAMESAK